MEFDLASHLERLRDFFLKQITGIRAELELYFLDFFKLLKALTLWSVPLILAVFCLSILPTVAAFQIGNLVDAVIGARGIGTMTIDVTRALRFLMLLSASGFLSEMFLSRFIGKALDLIKTAYTFCSFIVLMISLMQLSWFGVAVWPIIFLIIRRILNHIPYVHFLFIAIVIILCGAAAIQVTEYAVIRAITVGEAMTTVCLVFFYALVTSSIFLKRAQLN